MSEMRDLFGGFMGAVAAIALYVLAWGTLQRCFGQEVQQAVHVGEAAQPVLIGDLPQGAQVVPIGDLQPDGYMPQSGEAVVINDSTFIVVSREDWRRWTNAVARLEAVAERRWANEHKTDAGRRAWHGALKEKRVSEDGRTVEYTYADGFTYTEQVPGGARTAPAVQRMRKAADKAPVAAPRAEVGNGIPARLQAKRDAISARPAVREVNATFAPGGKLIKVEGEK